MIVKFVSNKTKTRILMKRRQLKGKPFVIMEDMASDLAKRQVSVDFGCADREQFTISNAATARPLILVKPAGI